MTTTEPVAWLAASLTLIAFSQRSMVPLRLAAIGSNVSFVAYGILAVLHTVVGLHLLLLLCNLFRLAQLLHERYRGRREALTRDRRPDVVAARQSVQDQQIFQPLTAAMLCAEVLLENAATKTEREAAHAVSASLAAMERELLRPTVPSATCPR